MDQDIPQIIRNARAFLERVSATGVGEARELTACAGLLESIMSGRYVVQARQAEEASDGRVTEGDD